MDSQITKRCARVPLSSVHTRITYGRTELLLSSHIHYLRVRGHVESWASFRTSDRIHALNVTGSAEIIIANDRLMLYPFSDPTSTKGISLRTYMYPLNNTLYNNCAPRLEKRVKDDPRFYRPTIVRQRQR